MNETKQEPEKYRHGDEKSTTVTAVHHLSSGVNSRQVSQWGIFSDGRRKEEGGYSSRSGITLGAQIKSNTAVNTENAMVYYTIIIHEYQKIQCTSLSTDVQNTWNVSQAETNYLTHRDKNNIRR